MDVKFRGIHELQMALEDLPKELMKSALSSVLRSGGKIIENAAKSKVPVRDGLLKRSIGTNVKTHKGQTTARVGPRTGFKGKSLGMKTNKNGVRSERFSDPNRYSHLVEFGTSHSAAKPFIRPAIDSTATEVVGAMALGLDQHLTKVAARLSKKR